jgi:hypothetical protein
MTVTPKHLEQSVTAVIQALSPAVDDDWSGRAGDLVWSCWETGVHIADDLVFYASQVIGQPEKGHIPFEIRVYDSATPEGLLRVIDVCGGILSRTVAGASPEDRAYHVYGTSDPEGFAAMGIVEVLVHGYDIARGLEIAWLPPDELSAVAVARLFPEPPQRSPAEVLLWCTGRIALPGLPRQEDWRWDGTVRA